MLINIKNSFANGEVKEFKEVKKLKESRQMLYVLYTTQKAVGNNF